MFTHYKTGENIVLRVRMYDVYSYPVPGIASVNSVQLKSLVVGGSTTSLTVNTQYTWSEVTAGAFAGSGVYLLTILSGVITQPGPYNLAVRATATNTRALLSFSVLGAYHSDVFNTAYLAYRMLGNSAEVAVDNTYTVYDNDGVTVLKRFDCKDINGNPTSTSIYQKIPR